jgi:hypothetical protein
MKKLEIERTKHFELTDAELEIICYSLGWMASNVICYGKNKKQNETIKNLYHRLKGEL